MDDLIDASSLPLWYCSPAFRTAPPLSVISGTVFRFFKVIDVLRQMVQFMVQRLMDIEGRCGAGYDEKNTERLNSRNGYHPQLFEG